MKKTVFIGLLVILLAFGFISCDNNDGNGSNVHKNGLNDEGGKKLIINEIGVSGDVTIFLGIGTQEEGSIAWGSSSNVVSGSNVTFNLKNLDMTNISAPFSDDSWNGNGSFFIGLFNRTTQSILDEFNNGGYPPPDYMTDVLSFSNETTIINWSQFIYEPGTGDEPDPEDNPFIGTWSGVWDSGDFDGEDILLTLILNEDNTFIAITDPDLNLGTGNSSGTFTITGNIITFTYTINPPPGELCELFSSGEFIGNNLVVSGAGVSLSKE